MIENKRLFSVCSIVILLVLPVKLSLATPASKDYSIDQVTVQAEILPNGSLLIEENRSYTFQGEFSWADYSLPLRNLGQVNEFKLSENEISYVQQPGKEPGTYQLSQDKEKFSVKWYYKASNESRTFTLRYRVEDVVTVYSDVAELYYKFVGEDSPQKIDRVDVWVAFPRFADTSQVRAWAHGPLHGQLAFEDGKIHLWVSPLPKRNWWEIRAIFPLTWVPSTRRYEPGMMKEKIMNEERELVEKSNAVRERMIKKLEFREKHNDTAFQLSWILLFVGIAVFVLIYNRYGRAHIISFHDRISSDIPKDLSPAIAHYIYYSGQIGAGAMVSTLFDLARREFLKIEETQESRKSFFGRTQKSVYTLQLVPEYYEKNKNHLAAYERNMIEFVFQDLAGGNNEIQLDEIKKSSRSVVKWFSKWKKILIEESGERPFYDKESVKGTIICAIISTLIVALGIAILVFFGISGLPALLGGIALFGVSFFILRYTKEIKLLRAKLIALKKYLSRYHFKRDSSRLQASLESFLIYGVALGIGTKVIKEMLEVVPAWQGTSYFGWYICTMGHGSSGGFADAVSSMVSATSIAMGSAAGVGGGASAGGGAGAGGASGGAG